MIAKYAKPPKTPAIKRSRDGRECCTETKEGRAEYLLRTYQMARRQKGLCAICGLPLGEDVSFDHQRGRGFNGGFRDDRIKVDGKWHNAAVHWLCNGAKGSRQYAWQNGKYIPVEAKCS